MQTAKIIYFVTRLLLAVYICFEAPRHGPACTLEFMASYRAEAFRFDLVGFTVERNNFVQGRRLMVFIPGYFLVLLLLHPEMVAAVGHAVTLTQSRRRKRLNQCASCGYQLIDLQSRCPECGNKVK